MTLRAEGELDSLAVSCTVQTGRALVEAGLHPASGGDGSLACSGDMLLQALVACAGGEDVDTLMKLTERYCVVYQTLARGVPVELSHAST